MELQILRDADAVAQRAAEIIAAEARDSVSTRGRFIIAFKLQIEFNPAEVEAYRLIGYENRLLSGTGEEIGLADAEK